jgi:hypothetical protein
VTDRLPQPAITSARVEPIMGSAQLSTVTDTGTDPDFPVTLDLRT